MLAVVLVRYNNGWHSPNDLFSKVTAVGARCSQIFSIILA